MRRTPTIKIRQPLGDGRIANISAKLDIQIPTLARDENQYAVSKVTDAVVEALRTIPYVGYVPLQNVTIK